MIKTTNSINLATKPPIGVKPRKCWEEGRLLHLKNAIKRYLDASLPVNTEWIEEYNELSNKLK